MSDEDLGRYSARGPRFGRLIAQHLIMKPYIWSALTVHVHGRRHLGSVKTPFIAIANHSSHLDTTLIFGALPRRLSKNLSAGAAADYFFTQKIKSFGTRLFFNAYPIDRGGMRAHRGMSGRLLEEGVPLLIYPEGTRSRTGAMAHFKPGVAALSIQHDVQVLPIALVGTYAAMPSTASVPVSGRPDVHIVFGRPMKAQPGEMARQFSGRLQRYVLELHDSTARAYGMPTQADYARAVALRAAAKRAQPTDTEGEKPPA
ncbi:lysophospholipid acyltransferase family protein [Nigerium massiliense]|uniref:lysophospholipid acyltransferase family protein n=1 Tax=Nigerium massiliense TaxID=1522317 RepID=UPI0006938604|nr:lysophospholipid acyltransferase family protein [Nigerium massiliense]